MDETRWNVLNGFARITQSYRDTMANWSGQPVHRHNSPRPSPTTVPNQLQIPEKSSTSRTHRDDIEALSQDYFDRWAKQVQSDADKWVAEARWKNRVRGKQQRPEAELTPGLSLLLDDDLIVQMETACGEFELVSEEWEDDDHESKSNSADWKSTEPITVDSWTSFFDDQGRFSLRLEELAKTIYTQGCDSSLRACAWMFLLGIFPADSDYAQRDSVCSMLNDEYKRLKSRWQHSSANRFLSQIVEHRLHRVEKDVVRTDRTSVFYSTSSVSEDILLKPGEDQDHGSAEYIQGQLNQFPNLKVLRDVLMTFAMYRLDIGYVQGMSDLAGPILALMQDLPTSFSSLVGTNTKWDEEYKEMFAFWTFVAFIYRYPGVAVSEEGNIMDFENANLLDNFHSNQAGMKTRLILVTYLLRLLAYEVYTTLSLLEDPPSPQNDNTRDRLTLPSGGGVMGMFWIFKPLLLALKRDLCPDQKQSFENKAKTDDYFEGVWRLWDGVIAGWSVGSHFMDVWICFAMLSVYVFPNIIGSRHKILFQVSAKNPAPSTTSRDPEPQHPILCFEDLLTVMSQLPGTLKASDILRCAQKWSQRLRRRLGYDRTASQPEERVTLVLERCQRDPCFWPSSEIWNDRLVALLETDGQHTISPVRLTVQQAVKKLISTSPDGWI